MKKFSFFLVGILLLWTITFALAEESKDTWALTGSIAWIPNSINNSLNPTTGSNTWSTTETSTWNNTVENSETTSTETNTWNSTEANSWDTVENTNETDNTQTTWNNTIENSEASNTEENISDAITTTISDSAKQTYDQEQIAAYEWAFKNWITTINNIDEARLTDWLTRAELAKMMSQYLTQVMWQIPTIEKVEYSDVDESLGDLADFIQTAYAYKIMWINADWTPLEEFNPNWLVTRADYATVFSRVLYGDKYNRSEWNYYEGHLAALKEAWILTNTTPTIEELRGWVMLMMYRSTNPVTEEIKEEPTQIANPAAEYCITQWGTINIIKDAEWNESGMCKLADGTEIDEWEYFRENHKETETSTTDEPIEDTASTGNTVSWPTLSITATPGKEPTTN